MNFALCPEDGLPRLIRFQYGLGKLAELNPVSNLLVVDKALYDGLAPEEQAKLIKTTKRYAYLMADNSAYLSDYESQILGGAQAAE